jgi:hypothetical protein
VFASSIDLGAQWGWGLIADGRRVYLTRAEVRGEDGSGMPVARNYMDRIDLTVPTLPVRRSSINIPGLLVAVEPGGRHIFTVDYQWNGKEPVNRFCALTVEGNRAFLDQALPVPAQMSQVIVSGGEAYFTTQEWASTGPSRTVLHTLDVRRAVAGAMREVSTRALSGSFVLRDVQAGHLFLASGGWWWWGVRAEGAAGGTAVAMPCAYDGAFGCRPYGGGDALVVFDLADPYRPAFVSATRLAGWILSLVVDGDRVYLPSGLYGVQEIGL